MSYLIDSDWVIDHLEQVPAATELLRTLAEEFMFISIVTYMEAYQGMLRKDDVALSQLADFVEKVPILSFSQAVAERAARLREDMIQLGLSPNRRAYDDRCHSA
jgi:predicted nucleic acid-binding protein